MKMKTISFNVLCAGSGNNYWTKRKPKVLEIIKKYQPDTFGLQEAHFRWMNFVCKALPEYDYVGIGRGNGKRLGEFSPVFYLKEKFELVDQGHFWLSETPDVPSLGWDARCRRICSYAVLKEKETGKTFVHANTHTDHIGVVAREKGAELIAEKLSVFKDIPVVLTGDFNDFPTSVLYKTIIEAGFCDSRSVAESSDNSFTFHNFGVMESNDVNCIIDYVFLKNCHKVNMFKVITDKVDGAYPSDHFPVITDFEI